MSPRMSIQFPYSMSPQVWNIIQNDTAQAMAFTCDSIRSVQHKNVHKSLQTVCGGCRHSESLRLELLAHRRISGARKNLLRNTAHPQLMQTTRAAIFIGFVF